MWCDLCGLRHFEWHEPAQLAGSTSSIITNPRQRPHEMQASADETLARHRRGQESKFSSTQPAYVFDMRSVSFDPLGQSLRPTGLGVLGWCEQKFG